MDKKMKYFMFLSLFMPLILGFPSGEVFANPYAKYSGTTLVVSFPAHAQYDAAAKLIPEFTTKTGIKVEIDKVDYVKIHDKQVLEMSKPKGDYDVVGYLIANKTEYVSKGFLAALAPFLANPSLSDPSYDLEDIVPVYRESLGMVGGKKGYLAGPGAALYAIPFAGQTSIFAYRKDIFDKHGLKPPKTYDEMLNIARTIREKEPGMYGLTMQAEVGHHVSHSYLNHGGEAFDDNWEPIFHKERSINVINTMKEILKTGPPGIQTFAYGGAVNAFVLGQASMYSDATVIYGSANNPATSKIIGKVGYAPPPIPKGYSTPKAQTGGFAMAIPQNSTKKEAAFLFIQWLTSKENDRKIIAHGGMPNRMSTFNDPEMQKQNPMFQIMVEVLKYANPDFRPLIPEWPEISINHIGVAVHEALLGKKTPEKAMGDIVEPVKKIMEKGGYYTWKR